jgi:hypothetical protein
MDKKAWSGKWSSGNESVLSIHKMTGKAYAHSAGTAKGMHHNQTSLHFHVADVLLIAVNKMQ